MRWVAKARPGALPASSEAWRFGAKAPGLAFATRRIALTLLLAGLLGHPRRAEADAATAMTGGRVSATTGADIYQHVCQGCHQPGGKGAVGAAAFPALAGNAHLENAGYAVSVVLNGFGGMPWFGGETSSGGLSDAQIAAVVTYIRSHFGNHYTDPVQPADVAAVRGPAPVLERY